MEQNSPIHANGELMSRMKASDSLAWIGPESQSSTNTIFTSDDQTTVVTHTRGFEQLETLNRPIAKTLDKLFGDTIRPYMAKKKKTIYHELPISGGGFTEHEQFRRAKFAIQELNKYIARDGLLRNRMKFFRYDVRMVGCTRETASPAIVVKCTKSDREALQKLLRKNPVDVIYVKSNSVWARLFGQSDRAQAAFQLVYLERDDLVQNAADDEVLAFPRSDNTLCGALLEYRGRKATIALVLEVDGKDYSLTVDHLINPSPSATANNDQRQGTASWCEEIVLTNQYKQSGATMVDDDDLVSLDPLWTSEGDETDVLQIITNEKTLPEPFAQSTVPDGKESVPSLKGRVLKSTTESVVANTSIDATLIDLGEGVVLPRRCNYVHLDGPVNREIKLERTAVRPREHRVPAYMVSGLRGKVGCRLLSCPSYLGFDPYQDPCEVWTILFDGSSGLLPGECGSVIVDQETFEVYGHVIGNDDPHSAYIIPTVDVISGLKRRHNATSVTLPTVCRTGWTDIDATTTIHHVDTQSVANSNTTSSTKASPSSFQNDLKGFDRTPLSQVVTATAKSVVEPARAQILGLFKSKLENEWKYYACRIHDANSKRCLRADSETGEWATHCCAKAFYHTDEIVRWMLFKDGRSGQTNLAALLAAAMDSVHHMRDQPGRLKSSDLGKGDRRCYVVFAILLNLDCGSLIHTFQRFGITDGSLANERLPNLDALKEGLQGAVSDVNRLLSNFDDTRFMFQHVVMDLNTSAVYSDRQRGRWISPFCRRQLVNDKGGTAQVWQVSVQEQFVSPELKERLGRSEFEDYQFGKCYSMALKTFAAENKEVFNQEKQNYLAVEGLVGMVQYLGEFEIDEEVHGQGVVRTSNLLLEFGELDLKELFCSPKDPPSTFESIVGFWEGLTSVVEAVASIHNLDAQRELGDSVRYDGWHADLKPDNILLVHGEFKLADLGFAKFRLKDETCPEPKSILTGLTETYGAPETDRRRRSRPGGTTTDYSQKIDIWSLGCVLSEIITWIVFGRQGVLVYDKLRQIAIKQLRGSRSPRQPTADDAFHDGQEVLGAVTDWHQHLRASMRKSDTATSEILDLIDSKMLQSAPEQRLTSLALVDKFAGCIAAAKATHAMQVSRGETIWLSDQIKAAFNQVEEEAELLISSTGKGNIVNAPSQYEDVGGRSSGTTLAHRYTKGNKSELLRQVKETMKSPRKGHLGTSPHFSPATGAHMNKSRLSPGLEISNVKDIQDPRDRNKASRAASAPMIVITEPSVRLSEPTPESQPKNPLRENHSPNEPMRPRMKAITQSGHPEAFHFRHSLNTHVTSNSVPVPHQTNLGVDTPPPSPIGAEIVPPASPRDEVVSEPSSPSARNEMVSLPPTWVQAKTLPMSASVLPNLQSKFEINPNWPISRQFESIKKKTFLERLKDGSDMYLSSFLVNRDIKFVIDNGGSMEPYWPAMRVALETLASMIGKLDKDGLDIEFTIGKTYNTSNAPVRKLMQKFDKARDEALRPRDPSRTGTDMATILDQIFSNYLRDTSKPMTLIVLSDGLWEGTISDEDVETSIVEFLRNAAIEKKPSNLRWFSIEFVSFGQAGVKKLEVLDDGLESKYGIRDVIDHEPVSGDVYKMILGSLNKKYDMMPSDTSFTASSSGLSPVTRNRSLTLSDLPTPASLSRKNSTPKGNRLSRILGRNVE
ncbi:hypothetical protein PG993_007391 [Apiospora rasikravindrae]|uniref:non-specific serine/threonine protein kinase n=1 Tax=Apiospora rasikravindrae TaxID=990691 RepID=A0ABR1SXD5_9PEZI